MESRVQIAAVRGWTGWSIGALVVGGDDLVRLNVTKMVHIAIAFALVWPSDGDDGDLSKGGLVERSPENRNQREHEHGHAEEGPEHLIIIMMYQNFYSLSPKNLILGPKTAKFGPKLAFWAKYRHFWPI